jgi:molybdopterin/thiamine biosynthesis adenylyltransferase
MVRKILITTHDLHCIEEDKNKHLNRNVETGGYIFGKLYPNGLALVKHMADGGPKAVRSPISFSGDNESATKLKERLQKEDSEIRLLGEYHVHPWSGLPNLSGGDLIQLHEVMKARPWFFVLLSTADAFRIFTLEDKRAMEYGKLPREFGESQQASEFVPMKSQVKEVTCQIVETEVASKSGLLDRILKITRNDALLQKTVLIIGLGSGGSTIAKYLGCTGVGRIILVDNEGLELANVIRHEGGISDLGKPKVEISKRVIESHNPFTVVEAYNLDVTKNTDEIERLTSETDLIIGSSGSSRVNNILNKFSLEKGIPAIYGGIYAKASGGYVLAVEPHKKACFNCLFGIASKSYSVDKEAAQRYGWNEEEMHQQQGLWIDISLPSLRLCKMALTILQNELLDYNLALFKDSLETNRLSVAKREDCAACNEDGWTRKQERPSTKASDLRQILRRWLRRRK